MTHRGREAVKASGRRWMSQPARRWLPVAIALLFAGQLVGPMWGDPAVVAYPDVAATERTDVVAAFGSNRIDCPGLTLVPGPVTYDPVSGRERIESVVIDISDGCRARRLQLSALEGETTVSRGTVVVQSGPNRLTVRMSPAIDRGRPIWWSVSGLDS